MARHIVWRRDRTVAALAPLALAWDASPGATSYRIYWGTTTGVYSASLNVGNVTSYSLPDPGPSFRFFAVFALDSGGEGPASNEFTR